MEWSCETASIEIFQYYILYIKLLCQFRNGAVTEWLRCTIRNRLGLSRVGSSPASIDNFFTFGIRFWCRCIMFVGGTMIK